MNPPAPKLSLSGRRDSDTTAQAQATSKNHTKVVGSKVLFPGHLLARPHALSKYSENFSASSVACASLCCPTLESDKHELVPKRRAVIRTSLQSIENSQNQSSCNDCKLAEDAFFQA